MFFFPSACLCPCLFLPPSAHKPLQVNPKCLTLFTWSKFNSLPSVFLPYFTLLSFNTPTSHLTLTHAPTLFSFLYFQVLHWQNSRSLNSELIVKIQNKQITVCGFKPSALCQVSVSPSPLSSLPAHCTTLAGSGMGGFLWQSASPLGWDRPWSVLLAGSVEGKRGASEGGGEEGRECLGGGRLEGRRRGLTAGNEVFSFHPQKAESERTGPGSAQLHCLFCLKCAERLCALSCLRLSAPASHS